MSENSSNHVRTGGRMKVALVILESDPSRGGAERYTVDLAKAMAARGHDVTLLSGDKKARGESQYTTNGHAGIYLPLAGATRSAKYRHFAAAVERWLAENSQDIVHAMLPLRCCNIYHPHAGIAVAALEGKPLQTFFNPRRRLFARIEREMLGRANPPVVLCLSGYVEEELRRWHPSFPQDHAERLFNAVDTGRFMPPAVRNPSSAVSALMVAQDFERKGLAVAVRALADAPGVHLTVVGRDDPAPYLKLAAECGVTERVSFAGGQKDMLPFYQNADFFVLPTRHDPCSLVVLEALACGLPVISTRFNGACEIMTDGCHGFVLPAWDDELALSAAMNELADSGRRMQMQEACVALRDKLSQERHLDILEAIYHKVALSRLP